jgi:hypothetical protein
MGEGATVMDGRTVEGTGNAIQKVSRLVKEVDNGKGREGWHNDKIGERKDGTAMIRQNIQKGRLKTRRKVKNVVYPPAKDTIRDKKRKEKRWWYTRQRKRK